MALDGYLELRKLIPHGECGAGLRAIARDDERAGPAAACLECS